MSRCTRHFVYRLFNNWTLGHIYCRDCIPKLSDGCRPCRQSGVWRKLLENGWLPSGSHCIRFRRPDRVLWRLREAQLTSRPGLRLPSFDLDIDEHKNILEPWEPDHADIRHDDEIDPRCEFSLTKRDHVLAQNLLRRLSQGNSAWIPT